MPRLARHLLLLATLLVAVTNLTLASAATLAVHPFDSDDPLLGMAVADELANSFAGIDLLVGPEVTMGAIPPVMAGGGFVGLTRVLGIQPMYSAAGAPLLRDALGVDAAVTGRVLVLDDSYRLDLVVAAASGLTIARVEAPHARRDRLVAKAARVVAGVLPGAPAPAPPSSPPLDGAYATYVTALVYASSGLTADAADLLTTVPDADLPRRGERLREDLEAASAPEGAEVVSSNSRQLRRALFMLGVEAFDESAARAAFEQVADATRQPLARAWSAILAASMGDQDAAAAALGAATEGGAYPYGRALAASLLWARGESEGAVTAVTDLTAAVRERAPAALVAASIVAQMAGAPEEERAALEAVTRLDPYLVYPFERLSFIALDRNDALAAAEALAAAVELDPESDLYWTNLGWSYYLLGLLDRSEGASQRAVDLDANQYIAHYNLGLVRSVTGRLTEALRSYDSATRLDPAIDDEAIKDLESATQQYPEAAAVSYSLATLYEAEGRRAEAKAQYRRFLRLAEAGAAPGVTAFVQSANERLLVLDAPPPPLELLGGVTVRLGSRGPEAAPFHPGDRIFPEFEVSTPGDQLPARLQVGISLTSEATDVLAETTSEVVVPTGAVGFVIDTLSLDIPPDLERGGYLLKVQVTARDGSSAAAEAAVDVEGEAAAVRQLLSRNVVMTALESGMPLYGNKDLARPDAILDALVAELRAGASAAEEALPVIAEGRFAGATGGEMFNASTAADVADYLAYVLASGVSDYRFVFVDGYAAWAMEVAAPK